MASDWRTATTTDSGDGSGRMAHLRQARGAEQRHYRAVSARNLVCAIGHIGSDHRDLVFQHEVAVSRQPRTEARNRDWMHFELDDQKPIAEAADPKRISAELSLFRKGLGSRSPPLQRAPSNPNGTKKVFRAGMPLASTRTGQ